MPVGGETILLVENEPPVRRLIAAGLEDTGYRVLQARTGREAIERFDASVDLLLVDIHLPHIGGHDVIVRLRERRHSLKVLAMSGYPPDPDLPADIPFLAKPFSREDLLRAVRNALGG
jgi:CheY-like chemotaxis protein